MSKKRSEANSSDINVPQNDEQTAKLGGRPISPKGQRLEFRGEVAQNARAGRDSLAAQIVLHPEYVNHGLRDVVDVRLRVDAAGNRQPHEIHRGR